MHALTPHNPEPAELFYSYSHRDEDLRDELEKHLTLLQRRGLIRNWHDRRISPGSDWKGIIDRNLTSADIILLLVSADFLASDYCYDIEMKLALERHELTEATVIPIILRPVDWTDAPFAGLQALPNDGKAITLWPNRDQAFAEVAKGIRQVITEHMNNLMEESIEEQLSGKTLWNNEHIFPTHGHTDAELELPNQPNAKTVESFLNSLSSQMDAQLLRVENAEGILFFTIDLHRLHLRGTNEPVNLLPLWEKHQYPEDVLNILAAHSQAVFELLLCFTEDSYKTFTGIKRGRNICVVSRAELAALAKHPNPTMHLSHLVVGQLGILQVCPYNTVNPAEGNMFFGRTSELHTLTQNSTTSFAIFGSSRIGKSSLLKQYRRLSLRYKLPHSSRMFFINLFGGSPRAEGFFRHIAMAISATRQAARVSSGNDFLKFLHFQKNSRRGPLDLLLDEVDSHCRLPEFEYLGHAAKEGLVRLILVGRANLMEFAMDPNSRFSSRLSVLRPGALDLESARNLLLAPMRSLGITFTSQSCITHICRMTGQLPFLLQYYGGGLVDIICKRDSTVITEKLIEEFESNFDTVHFLMLPLAEISDTTTRALALAILKSEQDVFTVNDISDLARRLPLDLSPDEIFTKCNHLCIYGVLVYHDGKFRIAHGAVRDFAHKLGYLD